jgi:hypothetical protein
VRPLLVVLAALCCAASAHAGPNLLVGIDDDTIKWMTRPNGVVGVNRDLGLDALRVTVPWRGEAKPTRLQGVYLHRIALAVALGQRIVLAVYGSPQQAPVTSADRTQYCGFLVHVLQRIPAINDVVIWNEVNNPLFWRAGPEAYEALLARCWDGLHSLRRSINVISSTAPHQNPGGFLTALGAAYRASGRTRPILDTYGHNIYPESSSEAPNAVHADSGSIDQGDYPRLVQVLNDAFGGTAQPLPGQGATTIWYLEDGYQSAIPRSLARVYGGRENEPQTVSPEAQAQNLRTAVELAFCQPYVGAFFNFELLDERRLDGWQSGLLYTNGQKKPAYEAYKQAIADIHAGTIDCATLAP